MNKNHASRGGRFCSRGEARVCSPCESAGLSEFSTELYERAERFLRSESDVVCGGGKCLILLYPSGDVEMLALSPDGCSAYEGIAAEGEALPKRRGKIGGVQDGHNIRRGIRRWIERNTDVIGDRDVCLRVIREGDALRLSAVRV